MLIAWWVGARQGAQREQARDWKARAANVLRGRVVLLDSVTVIRNAYESLGDRNLMKTFSERKGLKPVSETIQISSMTNELRNSLWNALHLAIWSKDYFVRRRNGSPRIMEFSLILWSDYFKKPVDSRPHTGDEILQSIRKYFFSCEWNEVYDFLELSSLDTITLRFDSPIHSMYFSNVSSLGTGLWPGISSMSQTKKKSR